MSTGPVLVLDLGGQYAQLIARRVRECGVYSELVGHEVSASDVGKRDPAALILSGGPASVYAEDAPLVDTGLFELGVPTLGICYGAQLMAKELGGTVERTDVSEFGKTALRVNGGELFAGLPEEQVCWMSHRDTVTAPPEGARVTAGSPSTPVAAFEAGERGLYGVQFHPEVVHTPNGQAMLENFLLRGAGLAGEWTAHHVVETLVDQVRETVGDKRVLCALSGGVDSSVAAALVQRAVGDQLTCVFVDHGLLRAGESEQVEQDFVAATGVGHVSAGMAEAISRARFPVVVATRTGAGTTFRNTYGFTGSESDLIKRGAVMAGWLCPRKARVLLRLALGAPPEAVFRMELAPASLSEIAYYQDGNASVRRFNATPPPAS